MIKSPEKQYNAYRILKVLASHDYLAVDYSHSYYVLSPVKNRYSIRPKTRSIQATPNEISKMLKPKQCIQIDHLHYYVFAVGKHEVTCANNFDQNILKPQQGLFYLLVNAANGILKHMLMKQAKQVRKYIDIRNALIVNGQLYLLQLNRGKLYPRSLQKSERLLLRTNQNDSFRQILQNQLRIVKYFGLLLWQIIYKSPYSLKKPTKISDQINFTKKMLIDMISKRITYQYICIRIKEEESKKVHSKDKRLKNIRLQIKHEPPRYRTESMDSNRNVQKRQTFSHLNTQSKKFMTPMIQSKKKKLSEINTGEESIQVFKSKLPKFNQKRFKLASIYRSTGENSSFRSFQSKISAEVNEKLMKQGQIAKNLYRKYVESKFTLRRQNDDQISQNARFKLINKIQRFKTQHKSHSRQRTEYNDMSHKNVVSNLQSYEPDQTVTKRLNFSKQESNSPNGTIIDNIPTPKQNKLRQSTTESIIFKKIHTITANKHEQTKQQTKTQSTKQTKQIKKQQNEEQIQFQVINFHQMKPYSYYIPQKTQKQVKIKDKKQQQEEITRKIDDKDQNSKKEEYEKRRKLISQQQQSNDEIEVFKLQKSTIQRPNLQENKAIIPEIKMNQQQKPQITLKQIKIDKIVEWIEQFQSLISILGDISKRSIRINTKLNGVQWKKAVYFIYQRFIYERDRFQEALFLGVRQIIRKNRIVSDQEWDAWLISDHRKKLISKIQEQNKSLKVFFNIFAAKIPSYCKFQPKIDFFIRNRQKVGISQLSKIRELLAKFATKYIIEVYNTMVDNEVSSKQLLHFVEDCLFACFIIAEIDNKLPSVNYVKIPEYQQYVNSIDSIDPTMEFLYSIYFKGASESEVQA